MNGEKKGVAFNSADAIKYKVDAMGTILASSPTDATIRLGEGRISAVGLDNLLDVESLQVTSHSDLTSYLVKFRNGGNAELVFDGKGALINLKTKQIEINVAQNNTQVVLGQKKN